MNTEIVEQKTVERIVVALDASPNSMAALQAAAQLAQMMQVELHGLFVEDDRLLQLCNSPFCREVGLYTASVRQLESQMMERQMRVWASEMRRSLARVAGQMQLRWSFQVARGKIEAELLAAAEQSALLSLGRGGWLAGRALGSTAQSIVDRTPRPILILGEKGQIKYPLTLVYTGSVSAERGLQLAMRLVRKDHNRLQVLVVANDDESQELEARLMATLAEAEIEPTVAVMHSSVAAEMVVRTLHDSTLILPVEYVGLLADLTGPVILTP